MDRPSLSRRQLLAGGVAGALTAATGCLGFGGDTRNERGERALRLTMNQHDGPLRDRFVVDLAETKSPRDEEAFRTTLDGGAYTTEFFTPFGSTDEDPEYTLHEGTYYRLGSVVTDEVTATYPILRLYEHEGSDDGNVVAVESLPETDRRAVQIAYFVARARGNEGGVPWSAVERGGYVYRREAAREDSTLLTDDGPERVRYRETTYDAEISRETFHDPVYRATVVPVADSPEGMERILRASFVDSRMTREELSSDARRILEQAAAASYDESHPYSDGYRELLRQFDERAYLDGDVQSDALREDDRPMVQYDDRYYDYRLRFVETGG